MNISEIPKFWQYHQQSILTPPYTMFTLLHFTTNTSHNHSVPSLQYVTHPSSQCKVLVGLLNKAQIKKLTLKHCFSRSIWAVFSELVLNTIFNKSTNFCNDAPLKRKGELLVTETYW